MCGRTFQKTPLSEIRVLFGTVNPLPNFAPTYNAAPTDTLPVVRLDRDGRRALDLLRCGLIPWWAKDAKIGAHCINAMAETVTTKPAFRDAFNRGQRCLVPVDGFYEWQKRPAGPKQPYAIVSADHAVRDGRPVGSLAAGAGGHANPHVHGHHRAGERTRRPDPQPDARHHAARGIAAVVGRGRSDAGRAAGVAAALPRRVDASLSDRNSRR
jgi:SOS response associated peptidase (SRAP)